MIYSVYIINKAGGLIYDEDFSWNKNTEEHTWQQHPIPLVFTADTGRVLVKFGEVRLAHVIAFKWFAGSQFLSSSYCYEIVWAHT